MVHASGEAVRGGYESEPPRENRRITTNRLLERANWYLFMIVVELACVLVFLGQLVSNSGA